jgi:glycogen(starch) synthase
MKVALLSFEYPDETGFGGIGTYTWYQARALVKLGHDVHVLAGAVEPTPLRIEEHDGVLVHRYRSHGCAQGVIDLLNKRKLWWTSNRVANAWNMYQAWKVLDREHHFDVVEMPECGADGALINHMTAAQTVVRFHSPSQLIMPYYDVRPMDIRLCGLVEKSGMLGAQAFTSCSKFLADAAKTQLGIRKPVSVIPNGIDLQLFDSADRVNIRKKYGLSSHRPIIFFSGRMEPRKGIHLCEAIAGSILERYEVEFVFAGQDLFNHMAETLLPALKARKLKGSVHYLGKLNLTDIRSFLTEADMFLIPALWENCP